MNNYTLPGIYIENGLQEKRKSLESFATLFLSFELKIEDIKENKKFIYLESVSEMKHYRCFKEHMILTKAIKVYFENGGKHLYLIPQINSAEILFDNSKYIQFLAQQLDYLTDIETILAIDIFFTENNTLSDINIQNIQNSISTYCKSTNRLSLMDLSPTKDPIIYSEKLYYTMSWYPWILDRESKVLPPSIYAAALFSKLSAENKFSHSIANIELKNIIDTTELINKDYSTELYKHSINPIVYIQNNGYRIWGIKTMADNIDIINTLRVFFFIKRKLFSIAKEYVFEPNNSTLEEKILRKVRRFLLQLWEYGVLQGYSKDEAFYLKIERSEQQLVFIVAIAIVKPLEYMIIHLNRTTNDNSAVTLNIL